MTLVSYFLEDIPLFKSDNLFHSQEINAGFAMVEYTAEEGVGLLRVCLEVFGLETLSQASLVRVQTIPGTAEG